MGDELSEIIRKAQEQPGVSDVIEVQRMYDELLRKSGLHLSEDSPEAIGSYSSDAS